MTEFMQALGKILPYHTEEPMSAHTTFCVGGPADIFCAPEDVKALADVLRLVQQFEVPLTVVGAGSNLLVSDSGIRGLVLKLGGGLSSLSVSDTTITAGAGVSLARLANFALSHSLTGLEFASGIPGLLGGAVYMNAGAYGGEMKDVVTTTTALDRSGSPVTISGEAHAFSYRHSAFSETDLILVESRLSLAHGDHDAILATMRDLNRRRKEKQPLEFPSAGSTFKRPQGHFAGKLIQDAGLQGYQIGGARVSDKHAGFVINAGGATACDIYRLIRHIQTVVFAQFGVMLEPEVKMLGDFSDCK